MIHFKLKMEREDEKKKYRSLRRIGIQAAEVKKAVYRKVLVIFLVSPIYSILISLAFSHIMLNPLGLGIESIVSTIAVSILFLLVHLLVYRRYARAYFDDISLGIGDLIN